MGELFHEPVKPWRSHRDQHSRRFATFVLEDMGYALGALHKALWARQQSLPVDMERDFPFQHVKRFIFSMINMRRRANSWGDPRFDQNMGSAGFLT